MRNLTVTICLTIAVLLGSVWVSWSADYLKKCSYAYSRSNYATAVKCYTSAAKQGNARAQHALGRIYANIRYKYTGVGTSNPVTHRIRPDYKTAAKWFTLAAKQGHVRAQYELGQMYRIGLGVPKNFETAMKWYRLAAAQGFGKAKYIVKNENKKRQREIDAKVRAKKLKQKIRSNSRISKIRANENLKDNYGFKELRLGMSIKDIKNIKECRIKRHYPVQGQVRTTSLIHCYKKEISINLFGDYLEKITLPMGFLAGMPTTKVIGGVVELGDWEKIRNILSKKYKENFTFSNRDIDLFNRTNKRLYTVFESGSVALEIYKKKVQYVPQPHFKVVYRGRETAKKFFNSVKPQAELKAKDF
jgi:hypothetical protein